MMVLMTNSAPMSNAMTTLEATEIDAITATLQSWGIDAELIAELRATWETDRELAIAMAADLGIA